MLRVLLLAASVLSASCSRDVPREPPPAAVLGEAPGIVNAVAVDGEHVYAVGWHHVNKGFVVRVPIGGGDIEQLAHQEGAPKIAAFHDGRLYWDDGYAMRRLAVASGEMPETILAEGRGEIGMAVDDRHTYYVSGVGSPRGIARLLRVPVTGGEPEVMVADVRGTRLAVSEEWVYWAHADGVSRVHKAEGRVEKLADGPAQDLALDGDFVYLCRQFSELHRVPKDGGTDENLERACGDDMIVVDGVSYWTDTTYGEGATHLSVGVVYRHAPGGQREEIYKGDLVSNIIAVGDSIYFGAGTKLIRVPR